MGDRDLHAVSRAAARVVRLLTLAGLTCVLFWLVWIYANGLRDPRYLDGWVLAAGFGLQLGFHAASKSGRLPLRWAARWRAFHIYVGYFLVAAFASHANFSLPDTGIEWALWIGFALVTLSGALGTYLAWSLKTNPRIDASVPYDRIPARQAELARHVEAIATDKDQTELELALPGLPHEDWIADLHAQKLEAFFKTLRGLPSMLFGSQAALKLLMHDIDQLSRYVDKQNQEKLAAIKVAIVDKDRLDFTRVYLWITKAWLFVHVPVTYGLIVLTVFHVVVVYAYSSGAW